jgi:hypothetical protein
MASKKEKDESGIPSDTQWFDSSAPSSTPNDRVAAVAAKHRNGGPPLVERLKELHGSTDPDRHNKAVDMLLEHIGDDEVTTAFNAIPRHL